MDFEFSDEQRLLTDSVERLMRERYGAAARRAFAAEAEGWSRDIWRRYADLGLLALPFSESGGGIGGGPVEMMIVMQAFGRGLILEPYLATVVLGGGLIGESGSETQRAALLGRVMGGEWRLAFAQAEGTSHRDLAEIETTAHPSGGGWVLNGAKTLIVHGDCAEALIVSARTGGQPGDRDGIGLFLVDAEAAGLRRDSYTMIDGRRAADLTLSGVRVGAEAVLGDPAAALPVIERVIDRAIAALAAEAVGAMAAVHEMTVDYVKTRVQFGTPIGKFQAVQHRAADMLVALEQARSMMMFGAMTADHPNGDERRPALAAVKVQTGRSARTVAQHAIQLHGAIGVTAEYALSDYVQRLTVIETLFGDTEYHLRRLAAGGGLFAAEA